MVGRRGLETRRDSYGSTTNHCSLTSQHRPLTAAAAAAAAVQVPISQVVTGSTERTALSTNTHTYTRLSCNIARYHWKKMMYAASVIYCGKMYYYALENNK